MEFNPDARLDPSQVQNRRDPKKVKDQYAQDRMDKYDAWLKYLRAEHPDWPLEVINRKAKEAAMKGQPVPPRTPGTITDITTPQKGIDVDNSDAQDKGTYPFLIGGKQFDVPTARYSPGTKQRAGTLRKLYKQGGWAAVRDFLVRNGFSEDIPVPTKGQNGFVVSATQSFLTRGVTNTDNWNKWFVNRYGNPTAPTSPGTNIPADTTDGNGNPIYPSDPTSDPTSDPSGGVELDPITGSIIGNISQQLSGEMSLISPELYSRSLANEKYNPVIAELRRQIALQRAQGDQNLQNIQDWSKSASDKYSEVASALQQGGQQALADFSKAANSFGAAMPDAAINPAVGAGESEFLASLAATDQSWASKMAGLTQNQRNDSLAREQALLSQERNSLRSDLLNAQKAKADYRSQAREQAVGTRLEQLQAYINMALGLGQFDLSKTKLNYDMNNPQNGLQNELTRAQITRTQAETDSIINDIVNPDGDPSGVADFNSLTAGDFADLSAALSVGIDPSRMTPLQVANFLGDRLRVTSGGAWDPKSNVDVRRWRNQLLYQLFPDKKKAIDRMIAANPALQA